MVVQHCECAKCHWTVHFKMVSFKLCEIYHSLKTHARKKIVHLTTKFVQRSSSSRPAFFLSFLSLEIYLMVINMNLTILCFLYISGCCFSVAQLCPAFCNPMDCSTPASFLSFHWKYIWWLSTIFRRLNYKLYMSWVWNIKGIIDISDLADNFSYSVSSELHLCFQWI